MRQLQFQLETVVREYVDEVFGGKVIGSQRSIDMPHRSPDLIPMEFCFWGSMKCKFYASMPNSIEDLKTAIEDVLTVCLSVPHCLQCVNAERKQFEKDCYE